MSRLLFILALLLIVPPQAATADRIETIDLQNRPAEELIPVLRPMLDEGGSMTGQGFKLIVRSSDENIEQIRSLVRQLDAPARQLLISVFQGEERDLRSLDVSGEIQHQGDNISTRIGGTSTSRDAGGGGVSYSTRNTRADANAISTRGRTRDNPVYTLRISEGSEGYIQTGSSDPVYAGAVWSGPLFGGINAGVAYKDVQSGFYVRPRTHGDQVTLDVNPYKESPSQRLGGAYDTQSAVTTVSGKLGQWIQIGAITEDISKRQSQVGSLSSTQSRNNAGIWIKADVLP